MDIEQCDAGTLRTKLAAIQELTADLRTYSWRAFNYEDCMMSTWPPEHEKAQQSRFIFNLMSIIGTECARIDMAVRKIGTVCDLASEEQEKNSVGSAFDSR
jgi:hypothetical protein